MYADKQVRADVATSELADLAAEVFTLLADPTRIRLVLALSSAERSVGELAELVGRSGPAVSQHLAKLRWARVVQTRQVGTRVYYSLVDEHALTLVDQAVKQAEHAVDLLPRHHLVATEPGTGPEPDR